MNKHVLYLVKNHPLSVLLCIGLILRLWFVFSSDHIYFPDEVFQVLEPAYRIVYGYGIIPWEFTYGLRSYLPAYFIAGWLWLFKQFNGTDPWVYVPLIKIVISLVSLSLVWSVYQISQQLFKSKQIVLLITMAVAIWYELVYLAPRFGTEMIATNLFFISWALLLKQDGVKGTIFAFFLTGLAVYLRPQYFFSLFFLGYLIWKANPKTWQHKLGQASMGIGLAGVLGGIVDWWTLGHWFYSITQNISLSFASGVSHVFGEAPWYQYGLFLGFTSLGWFYTSLFIPKQFRYIGFFTIGILGLHSIFGHKEYRFITLCLPLLVMLSVVGTESGLKSWGVEKQWRWKIMFSLIIGISVLGWLQKLPHQTDIYSQPLLQQSAQLHLYKTLAKYDKACGIFDMNALWVLTGGYYYLGKDIPIYTLDTPPPSMDHISHILVDHAENNIDQFDLIQRIDRVGLFYREGGCAKDPTYSYSRSIPVVEEMIQKYLE